MPMAGGIAPPVIVPLVHTSYGGNPFNEITTDTFIELATETPNCAIYFTTNGSKPNPWKLKSGGYEQTFRYKGPFTMMAGKRTLKAVAVHRVTKAESHVVTRTFFVDERSSPSGNKKNGKSGSSPAVKKNRPTKHKSRSSSRRSSKDSKRTASSPSSSSGSSDSSETSRSSSRSKHKHGHVVPLNAWDDDLADSYLQRNADQGFAATNHSGTQINLWGSIPGLGWDVKTPGRARMGGTFPFPGATLPNADGLSQQQLNAIANQLTQRIEQSRQMTIADVRKAIQELEEKQGSKAPPKEPTPKPAQQSEPNALPVSPGNGDVKDQLQHVYAHLLQFARSNNDFRTAVGQPKMGRVLSAEFDEGSNSYLLTIHLAKPGFPEPLHKPKTPAQPTPTPPAPKETPPPAKPAPVIPKGHELETKVTQSAGIKAKPIELKTEEKPKEKVESAYFETEEYVQDGTLKPSPTFDANADCQTLRKAMKGLGTDERAIIEVMGRRSFTQRQAIVQMYKSLFGKELVKEFESELSGNFLKIIKALCLAPDEYDAMELRNAMKGLGTDEDCLIEIICTRTNAQLKALKERYKAMFNSELEKHVDSDTSSHFKRLLISLLQATRPEDKTFDRTLARKDAQELHDAGEKKWGTDESKFNEILLNRSNAHLRAMFEEYAKLSGKNIIDVLKSEMSGDLLRGMLTFVRCIQNKPQYFAMALQKAMKGLGTNDDSLLRVIVTRAEIDMVQIKDAFLAETGKTLGTWIKDDTSGDYRRILLCLINEEQLVK